MAPYPHALYQRAQQSSDPNIGSSRSQSSSASAVLSTLAPVSLVALCYFLAFIFLRRVFPGYYAARTFKGKVRNGHTTRPLPSSLFGWIRPLFEISDFHVLRNNSLDAYFMLRWLKICSVTCLVGCLIVWPVIFPVNITGGNGNSQLDLLTIGNIQNKYRYFAHAIIGSIFFAFVVLVITRESIYLVNVRQAYLMSQTVMSKISSRTVLYTSIPDNLLDEQKLRKILGENNVEYIWIPSDTKSLNERWVERNKLAARLEGAEVKCIKMAVQARNKSITANPSGTEEQTLETSSNKPLIARWIRPKGFPTHRLKPLVGKKVDTLTYCRDQIKEMTFSIDQERAKHTSGEAYRCRSAFVMFKDVFTAHSAFQSLTHHHLLTMAPRYIAISPLEVIWDNLNIRGWERVLRLIATSAFAATLTIFWSIPVAFVASIANIDKLTELLPWLGFINKLPPQIIGVVTGLLPVIAISVLISLVPFFLRLAAKFGGAVTVTEVETTVNKTFFWFQIVQVFLVATLGSAATSVIASIIDNPSLAPALLAQKLPASSTFYLCWFILQGLGGVGNLLVSIVGLIMQMLLPKIFWNTPRKMFLGFFPSPLALGSIYPPYTLLMCVAIGYAVIAPLTLAFAAIGLFLFYFVWRYNFLFASGDAIDTKGQLYADALQQLFYGIYIAQICLIGLFAIGIGDSIGSLGPLIIMIISLVFTILYHSGLNSALGPLLQAMPKSLLIEEEKFRTSCGRSCADLVGYNDDFKSSKVVSAGDHDADAEQQLLLDGRKPRMLSRFLRPHVYDNYSALRKLMPDMLPGQPAPLPQGEDFATAYLAPCIWQDPFPIWLPDDSHSGIGNTKSESFAMDEAERCSTAAQCSVVVGRGANVNDKGHIVFEDESTGWYTHASEIVFSPRADW